MGEKQVLFLSEALNAIDRYVRDYQDRLENSAIELASGRWRQTARVRVTAEDVAIAAGQLGVPLARVEEARNEEELAAARKLIKAHRNEIQSLSSALDERWELLHHAAQYVPRDDPQWQAIQIEMDAPRRF